MKKTDDKKTKKKPVKPTPLQAATAGHVSQPATTTSMLPDDLQDRLAHLLSPCSEAVESLQARMDEVQGRLNALMQVPLDEDRADLGAPQPDNKPAAKEASGPKQMARKERKRLVSVWQEFAASHLADMASSLDGVLSGNDEKLRQLFDKIDLDSGGTIDSAELQKALETVGKRLSDEAVAAMMRAADEDGNGEIDFAEFADVVRGRVHEDAAARSITASFRKAMCAGSFRKKRRSSLGTVPVVRRDALELMRQDRQRAERLLGRALMAQQANLKEMIAEWDRGRKGCISRIEFRRGVREDLGLHVLGNTVIDAWFDEVDTDGGGTLDLSELKVAMGELRRRSQADELERASCEEELAQLRRQKATLEALALQVGGTFAPAVEGLARLAAFRAHPHVAARVGERLCQRMGQLGMADRTPMKEWECSRTNGGSPLMERDEFVELAAFLFAGPTASMAPTSNGQTDGKLPKESSSAKALSAARPCNPIVAPLGTPSRRSRPTINAGALRRASSAADVVREESKRQDSRARANRVAAAGEGSNGAMSLAKIGETLEQAGLRMADVDALYAELVVTLGGKGESDGKVPVKDVLQALLEAPARRESDEAALVEQATRLCEAALLAEHTAAIELEKILSPNHLQVDEADHQGDHLVDEGPDGDTKALAGPHEANNSTAAPGRDDSSVQGNVLSRDAAEMAAVGGGSPAMAHAVLAGAGPSSAPSSVLESSVPSVPSVPPSPPSPLSPTLALGAVRERSSLVSGPCTTTNRVLLAGCLPLIACILAGHRIYTDDQSGNLHLLVPYSLMVVIWGLVAVYFPEGPLPGAGQRCTNALFALFVAASWHVAIAKWDAIQSGDPTDVFVRRALLSSRAIVATGLAYAQYACGAHRFWKVVRCWLLVVSIDRMLAIGILCIHGHSSTKYPPGELSLESACMFPCGTLLLSKVFTPSTRQRLAQAAGLAQRMKASLQNRECYNELSQIEIED